RHADCRSPGSARARNSGTVSSCLQSLDVENGMFGGAIDSEAVRPDVALVVHTPVGRVLEDLDAGFPEGLHTRADAFGAAEDRDLVDEVCGDEAGSSSWAALDQHTRKTVAGEMVEQCRQVDFRRR